jgi:hypothetical protein
MSKFVYPDQPGRWQPTPPSYMDGIEPHWGEIRTLVLTCFSPAIPAFAFSLDKISFYKEVQEV